MPRLIRSLVSVVTLATLMGCHRPNPYRLTSDSVKETNRFLQAEAEERGKIRLQNNAELADQTKQLQEKLATETTQRTNPVGDPAITVEHGVFTVPVRINKVLTLNFVIDSGASDVNIPADVASTLLRTGTIRESDFLPGKIYVMADGTTTKSGRFLIRQLEVGDVTVRDIPASIGNPNGSLLLGQSFLSRFTSWSIDNKNRRFVLE